MVPTFSSCVSRTTKSKLEGQKQGEGDAAFKELNKHAPGGPEAVPSVQGHNKSGGGGTGNQVLGSLDGLLRDIDERADPGIDGCNPVRPPV